MRGEALRRADEIREVNTRYHDVAAESYDSKWGIDFGEVGSGPGRRQAPQAAWRGGADRGASTSRSRSAPAPATSASTCCGPGSSARRRAPTSRPGWCARWPRTPSGLGLTSGRCEPTRNRSRSRDRELRPRARARRAAPPPRPRACVLGVPSSPEAGRPDRVRRRAVVRRRSPRGDSQAGRRRGGARLAPRGPSRAPAAGVRPGLAPTATITASSR